MHSLELLALCVAKDSLQLAGGLCFKGIRFLALFGGELQNKLKKRDKLLTNSFVKNEISFQIQRSFPLSQDREEKSLKVQPIEVLYGQPNESGEERLLLTASQLHALRQPHPALKIDCSAAGTTGR